MGLSKTLRWKSPLGVNELKLGDGMAESEAPDETDCLVYTISWWGGGGGGGFRWDSGVQSNPSRLYITLTQNFMFMGYFG